MTFDEGLEVIMFVVGGLVLAWGFRSLAFASSGGERSGMHELGAPSEASSSDSESDDAPETPEDKDASFQRRHRFYQAVNYALSLAAMAALTAMLIGAWLA